MDWKKAFTDLNRQVSNSYDNSVEMLLDRMGLEHKRSTMDVVLPMLGVFGAGIAVGASLGLLFAPKRGNEFRNDLRHRIDDLRERVPSYDELRSEVRDRAGNISRSMSDRGSQERLDSSPGTIDRGSSTTGTPYQS